MFVLLVYQRRVAWLSSVRAPKISNAGADGRRPNHKVLLEKAFWSRRRFQPFRG
jgi:hypothetical protein